MRRVLPIVGLSALALAGCSGTVSQQGTLAELQAVDPDLDEVYLEDSLERAAQSYRRYLEETPESARTPEAMRRLADLQIEQAYGVIGDGLSIEEVDPYTIGLRGGTARRRRRADPGRAARGDRHVQEDPGNLPRLRA